MFKRISKNPEWSPRGQASNFNAVAQAPIRPNLCKRTLRLAFSTFYS